MLLCTLLATINRRRLLQNISPGLGRRFHPLRPRRGINTAYTVHGRRHTSRRRCLEWPLQSRELNGAEAFAALQLRVMNSHPWKRGQGNDRAPSSNCLRVTGLFDDVFGPPEFPQHQSLLAIFRLRLPRCPVPSLISDVFVNTRSLPLHALLPATSNSSVLTSSRLAQRP
jgi:hypothetical protein